MSYEVMCHNLKCNCGVFAPIQECMSNKWNRSCFGLGMIATNGVILGLLLVCAWLCSSDGRTLNYEHLQRHGFKPCQILNCFRILLMELGFSGLIQTHFKWTMWINTKNIFTGQLQTSRKHGQLFDLNVTKKKLSE